MMSPNRLLSAVLIGLFLVMAAVPATAADEPNSSRPTKDRSVMPLKVFILAGQSNMQGHANVSTFDSMAEDPKTAPILKEMRDVDGKPRVCQKVWISSIGCLGDAYSDLREQKGKLTTGFGASNEEIGPEFTFGITMEKLLGEPILIIKTSWGGRSLHTDFRPPSAGPYVWSDYELTQCKRRGDDLEKNKAEKVKATGMFYRHMIEHVKKVLADIKMVVPDYDPKQGYELAGFVWFQGFNDLVSDWTYNEQMKPGGYDMYGELLAHFIRDVRKDLSAPKLPFVIGVMGIGGVQEGKKAPQMYFREAQAAPASLPEFEDNVVAVQTAPFWDDDLDALQQRMERLESKLEEQAKEGPKLTPAEKDAAHKQAIAENFTPDELKRLKGVSNGGYHYLGAAKILAPIGKAFAEEMVALTRASQPAEPRPQPSRPTVKAADPPAKTVTLSGKLVLPKQPPEGVSTQDIDLGKLTGSLQRVLSPVKLPTPDGYEKMTPEAQRAWLKKFVGSPEYLVYWPALAKWEEDQKKIEVVRVTFDKNGSFKVAGLQPGTWVIKVRLPHDAVPTLSRATFEEKLDLPADKPQVDLGERSLTLHFALAPGDVAPDFIARTYDGKTFKLSDYRGKYVLVDFWATWCLPCVAELPNIEAVYADYGGTRFEVIGLSLDQTIDAPRAFHEKHPSAYVHGYARERDESRAVKMYGVEVIPSVWLIGPDGKIVARDLRGDEIREAVSKALKSTGSADKN